MPRVIFSPEAEADVLAADGWWREHRPAAPDLFADEVAALVSLLEAAPGVGARARRGDARRLALRRTRYVAYYRFDEVAGEVHVLRLWHMSRGTTPRLP